MAFISSELRALLEARIVAIDARLTKLLAADSPLDGVKEFRLDTGEGSQRTEYFTPKELGLEIDRLWRVRDSIDRRLNGTGVININLRRKR